MYHKDNVKHLRRPKKAPADKVRRQAVQKKRLISLGVPEEEAAKMTPLKIRKALLAPAKIKAKA